MSITKKSITKKRKRRDEELRDDEEVTIEIVGGVEGPSVYLNDLRVCGPKPWGGGQVLVQAKIALPGILEALLFRNGPRRPIDSREALAVLVAARCILSPDISKREKNGGARCPRSTKSRS